MDLRSRRRYAANVDGNVSDAEEEDLSDDRVPFLQQIDQIDVNDAQEEGSSNNKPFCFEQIFGHCCTVFISFRIYCLKLSCLFKLRFFVAEVEIMKPKSGIAGDERNIAVLLFLYVLQVQYYEKAILCFY